MSELNRSPLADPGWHYLEKIALEDLSRDDWGLLEGQRQVYLARHQAEQALRGRRHSEVKVEVVFWNYLAKKEETDVKTCRRTVEQREVAQ